jgi:hypothetical protein
VNEKYLSRKELALEVGFSFAWGIVRHYVYEGLSNFDDINLADASLKTGLYTAYYVMYGGIYAAWSDFRNRVSSGATSRSALYDVKTGILRTLKGMVRDGGLQLNLVSNIANMFNPWVESRPSIASGLIIILNAGIMKHSTEREYGFWGYLKKTFIDYSYNNRNQTLQ